jgi:probable HAF family extracellular repeat protein
MKTTKQSTYQVSGLRQRVLSAVAVSLLAALAVPVQLAAQEKDKQHHPHQYHHYQLVDPGTFGGTQSFGSQSGGLPRAGILNNRGTLTGAADTLTVDLYCLDNPDCYAPHAFQMKNGVTTDLGALSGGNGSQINWISANGLMGGIADNGQQDPLNPALPQIHAVLWQHGEMTDLGTLPEGGYQSWAYAVNNRGEIAGQAYNTIPDSNSFFGYGYQSRAFYWKNGLMQDLGTLGGTDAGALLINQRGQVVGWSYINSVPSASCSGAGLPLTTGSFIWDKEDGMKDIGGFGGSCTLPFDLNDHGQVVGQSDLADQTTHPFVWDSETGMTDLGTPDGGFGSAEAINEHGDVVGIAETNGGPQHAVLWRKRGEKWKITDLGILNGRGCSYAFSINASGQVVGIRGQPDCLSNQIAFLWEDGGHMVDLNTLVPPNSGLHLFEAQQINDRGEIAVEGADANGNQHAVLLIPCDENHADVEGCDYSLVDASATAGGEAPLRISSQPLPSQMQRLPHSRPGNPFRIPSRVPEGGAAALAVPVSPVADYTRPHVFYVSLSGLTPSSVNPGGSSTSAVTVGISGIPNAVGTAALACTVQPSPPLAPTCSISPASLSFPGTPATLTVSTVGPSGALLTHRDHGLLYALWLPLIGLVATGAGLGSNPNRHKGKFKKAALVCALCAGLTFPLACGGGSSSSQRTPPGTYTINVTATAFIPVNTTTTSTTLAVQ